MYGLESTALKNSLLDRLDAFQMKGIRKIMKLQSSFVDRSMTNERAMRITNERINAGQERQKNLKKLSALHRERRVTALAKLIKMREQDPAAKITMDTDTFRPHDHGVRRVGKPRLR